MIFLSSCTQNNQPPAWVGNFSEISIIAAQPSTKNINNYGKYFYKPPLDLDKTKNPKPTQIPDFMNIKSNNAFKTFITSLKEMLKLRPELIEASSSIQEKAARVFEVRGDFFPTVNVGLVQDNVLASDYSNLSTSRQTTGGYLDAYVDMDTTLIDFGGRNAAFNAALIEKEIAYDWDPYNYPLSQDIVNKVKTEIGKYSYPVVAGFTDYGSTLQDVGSSGIWYPRYSKGRGGHAMTIVGYDDTFNGGSFRIVNSWGRDWGDDGYAWIRYSDFRRFCDSVFFTWLSKNIDSEMNQIRNLDNYTRQYANNGTRIYEGERNTDGFSGYGIVTFIDSDSHFAGWFEGGSMNGTFRVINSNGYFQIEYENGTPVDTEKLGFAASQESLKKLEETNDYISQMFPSLRFKQGGEESEEFKETID